MYTVHERERLLLHMAGLLARDRKARGLKLNVPEAQALICSQILEWAREGRPVAQIMDDGARILEEADVMPGVAQILSEIQLEATFPDGTKLVTVHDPIRGINSGTSDTSIIAGEILTATDDLLGLEDRSFIELKVDNTGDRPIQVGSHFHFFEVNKALDFDRSKAWGFRLNIAAGTAHRFEPGLSYTVALVSLAGSREVFGFNGLCNGSLDEPGRKEAGLKQARERGFKGA